MLALVTAIAALGGTVTVSQSTEALRMTYQGADLHAAAWTVCPGPLECEVTVGPGTDLALVGALLSGSGYPPPGTTLSQRVQAYLGATLLIHEHAHVLDHLDNGAIDGSPGHQDTLVPRGHCRTSAAERYACAVALTGRLQ